MLVPTEPKIYHIVHVDRLESIVSDGFLWSDAEIRRRDIGGTTIGMNSIKERRLTELTLSSHPNLRVGDCVPFYFCPRSVMLYLNHVRNSELIHQGGQRPIVHLEADLRQTVAWANAHQKRWVFTSSNAGSYYFTDYSDLRQLNKVNWDAVKARKWSGVGIDASLKEGKQAEFLVECAFPWGLVSRIGIQSNRVSPIVQNALQGAIHRPTVEVKRGWYY